MFRKWKFIFLLVMSALLLTACSESLGERAKVGINAAEEAFHTNDKEPTEEIDGVKLYKPIGLMISEKSDAQNIVFTKGKETFILFINPNEKSDSQLFYDLLLADQNKEIIEQATFTDKDIFGFAAVVKSEDDHVELITSVGGSKMTTLTTKKNIEENLTEMMEVVRSVEKENGGN
ncbi:hypothetical protein [Sporosarcina sp. YIM B06819]|uniref:hypothetical protein n=1 Tax=Sporosarcina sp. YIM B06819 TaxID=3081769 RepID=UPI00298CC6F0|nr:hypothetical protein [Sporosarcina sp. YIM B06819]